MSVPDAANSRASSGTGTEAAVRDPWPQQSSAVTDNLPLSALRGQTYDGASSMAGQYSGCQAFIRQKNPLALYVHCGAHCVNLVMEAVAVCSPHLRDPVQWVHELGTLSVQSGKFKAMFAGNAADTYDTYRSLRPLCPTRWTVRVDSIRRVISQ